MNKPTIIGIDCRLSGLENAGIGRYIEHLVVNLANVPEAQEIHWVFFFNNKRQYEAILNRTDKQSFFKKQKKVYTAVRHYSIQEQTNLPQLFHREQLDLLHVPHFNVPIFYRKKMVVTIHDLLWHEYRGAQVTTLPWWKYWLKHALYRYVVGKAVHHASVIYVPTHTVEKTIQAYFPELQEKIRVTYEGVDPQFFIKRTQNQKKTARKIKKLLFVGSLYPHKNVRVILDMLELSNQFTVQFVGSRNVFQEKIREEVKQRGLEKRVEFLGSLSDAELLEVMKESFALVQPSLFEGFGLTGIEAMATELPVVASNIPVFQEIYADRAVFFDPHDANTLFHCLNYLDDEFIYDHYSSFQKTIKHLFDWEQMARKTVTEYLTCIEK